LTRRARQILHFFWESFIAGAERTKAREIQRFLCDFKDLFDFGRLYNVFKRKQSEPRS
jgi:hypothetical protein